MGTGQRRIAALGEIQFRGKVGEQVAEYAKQTQRLGRDMASELNDGAIAAREAMGKLKGHPLLLGLDVKARARWVARRLDRARECALGISAEAVKFNQQYRAEFLTVQDAGKKARYQGRGVDL